MNSVYLCLIFELRKTCDSDAHSVHSSSKWANGACFHGPTNPCDKTVANDMDYEGSDLGRRIPPHPGVRVSAEHCISTLRKEIHE